MCFALISCTPQEVKKNPTCSSSEIFDEVKRTCVVNSTPRLPVATTVSLSILENLAQATYAINYNDYDGDLAQSCSVTSSNAGLAGVIKTQGVVVNIDPSLSDGILYTLTLVDDILVSPGFEYATLSGYSIVVHMRDAISVSSSIANAINSSAALVGVATATATETFRFQRAVAAQNFQGAFCECVNGICSATLRTITDFYGATYFEYYISDTDGNSDVKRLNITVQNIDAAPVTVANTTGSLTEDSTSSLILNYTDVDSDKATACSISSLNANLMITSACSCNASGICSVGIRPVTNYNTEPAPPSAPLPLDVITYFNFTVTANSVVSNLSSYTGVVNPINDAPVVSNLSFSFNEDDQNNATYVENFNLVAASDVDNTGPFTYDRVTATPAQVSITGCLDGTSSLACVATIDGDYNPGNFSLSYRAFDGTSYSTIKTITFTIVPKNDLPYFSVAPLAFNINESDNWIPLEQNFTLTTANDEESGALTYSLSDASGVILTDGATLNGRLYNCLNLSGTSSGSDLSCSYIPNDGNYTGTETFYYVANDGSLNSDPLQFTVTLLDQSDIPTICQYSKYNKSLGRTECGINGCIGEGSPAGRILPTSHLSTNPVAYFDNANGVCYISDSTASWTKTAKYIPDVTFGEKENVIISDIIINEGGSSLEDTEQVTIDPSTLTVSNIILTKKENIFIEYDLDIDGVYEISIPANGASTSIDTIAADDVASGRARIRIVPTAGQIGKSRITFSVVDSGAKSTTVSFEVEILPLSIIHNGWAKIQSIGNKTDKFMQPIEKNAVCNYSRDKCNNGGECLSTSTAAPSLSADFKGAIFKTANGCYIATDAGKNSWGPINSSCDYSANLCNSGGLCYSSVAGVPIASADSIGAIYKTGDSCYRAASTGTDDWVEIVSSATNNLLSSKSSFCNITEVKRFDARSISKCSYSTASCDGGKACVSVAVGAPSASADVAGAIFRDGHGNCYQALATGSASWGSPIFTSLDNDLVDDTNTCDDILGSASCTGELSSIQTPTDIGLLANVNDGVYFYNTDIDAEDNRRCWYSNGVSWTQYSSSSQITIGWEAFTVSGTATVTGYNVYRKKVGESFDYQNPLNNSVILPTVFEYVDNGTNSRVAPTPGIVYFYEVRPIVTDSTNTLEVTSNSVLKNVRVISAPDNTVFAHRWMMNKKICSQMNSASAKELNYICAYTGMVDTDGLAAYPTYSSQYIYDIGNDLIVNRFEIGCPYTKLGCNTDDGSCIDGRVPVFGSDGAAGDYFYNRNSGVCSYNNGAAWVNVNALGADTLDSGIGEAAFLPPLSNVSRTFAAATCSALPAMTIEGHTGAITKALPNKKQQLAYSQWELKNDFDDSDIAFYEEGLSLNALSKCNSASASGIDFGYTDDQLPDSNTFYSIPGMASSIIRSVYTGSSQTRNCVSMFGVQDMVGNVAEWTSDSFTKGANETFTTSFASANTGSIFNTSGYSFDETTDTGPCDDALIPGVCSGIISSWKIEDRDYDATKFDVASGLPVTTMFDSAYSADPAFAYMLEIGSSVTAASLHDDEIILHMSNFGATATAAVVTGGGYVSAGGAGIYNFELVTPTAASFSDIGFRCAAPINYSNYQE